MKGWLLNCAHNILAHPVDILRDYYSDAQVPFTIKVIDSDEVNAFALRAGSSM